MVIFNPDQKESIEPEEAEEGDEDDENGNPEKKETLSAFVTNLSASRDSLFRSGQGIRRARTGL